MASTILNYLKWQSKDPSCQESNPVRALPASWYTSQEMYNLERRAIFSRKWQLLTHKNRFTQTGDWLKFDVAGYEVVLAQDRKGSINGFHNICRHRAFPIVQNQGGTARIFACKYHGWSYGLDGKLAKAPGYDELENFDKSHNSLFQIHVRIDAIGFIWVNLDGADIPELPWEAEFGGIDTQERYQQYNFDDYILDHEYQVDGQYNWKILADNFNECYHCPTAHPDIPTLLDIETLDTEFAHGWIKHQSKPSDEQQKLGLAIATTYFFPNASISILPHFIMLQRFVPRGPNASTMHYQIFRNKHSSEESFQLVDQLYKKVIAEDKVLCELAQKNLDTGVFVNGEMHSRLEKGPLQFQNVVRLTIKEHLKKEKQAGHEIWPARQKLPTSAGISKEDEKICSDLSCQAIPQSLDW